MKKKIVLLGSTGSIGTQALSVIKAFPDAFEVCAILANTSAALLEEQARLFHPRYAGLADTAAAKKLQLPAGTELVAGPEAGAVLAALPEADIILNGIGGIAGLPALLSALKAGKTVALANKESIVCGYALVKPMLEAHGGVILPVDSEHSAIFQCLQNSSKEDVAKLHLTASGGPFWNMPESELRAVTVEQALRHPVWRMGRKVSIDSATLFNKGLEVIEASYLFDVPNDHICVLIHPQSIVHSMVEYQDGAVIAQLSMPDMRLAIQYALSYPRRIERQIKRLSLAEIGSLTFFDADAYPAIRLARMALQKGGALPIAYNAANEAAVDMFLEGGIGFLDIRRAVEYAMERAPECTITSYEDIMAVDAQAREDAVGKMGRKH